MTKKTVKNSRESWASFFCDYFPLVVFFIFYKFSAGSNQLITATIALMIATLIALVISYILTKKIAKMALFSGLILGIFGTATIILRDEIFIKMKPTVINLLFAAILFYCYFAKKLWLSNLLGSKVQISNKAWLTLSWRWGCFFVLLACVNEVIWRNFSTDFWVQFKVFGMMPISLIFTISQIPFMINEIKKFEIASAKK
ncbi:MAG: septation protein A [Proteobacteria bacterium]|nr:septation protein A [Pseudomonadota bacterium]